MKDRRVVFMMRMQVVYLQGEKFPFLCLGSGGLCALIAAAFFFFCSTALHCTLLLVKSDWGMWQQPTGVSVTPAAP
jgi:hypothetical protein